MRHGYRLVIVFKNTLMMSVLTLAADPSDFCLILEVIAPPTALRNPLWNACFRESRFQRSCGRWVHTSPKRPPPSWSPGRSSDMNVSFSLSEIAAKSARDSSPFLLYSEDVWLALILNELHIFNSVLHFSHPAVPFAGRCRNDTML